MNLNQGKNKKIFLLRGQKRRILFSFLCNDKCDWNLQQLWIADWTPAEMEDVMVTDDRGDRKTDASGEIRPFGLRDKIGYMFGQK